MSTRALIPLIVRLLPCFLVGFCATGCDSSFDPDRGGDSNRAPNVLFVSLDTVRADHLSCYGYERETSPCLDRLARDGARFEAAYAHVPFTLMSHMSMMTSMFPETHGVTIENGLVEGIPLLAEVLSEGGYRTAGRHNVDWLEPVFGFDRGFDEWTRDRSGADTLAALPGQLARLARGEEPFFYFVHLMDAHSGPLDREGAPLYAAPEPYRDRFLPHPDVDATRHLARDIYEDRATLTPEEKANVVARYDGGILYVDSIVGALVAELKRLGTYEETLIVVTSDHGESLGDHETFAGHGFFWENGLRVPLIVKLPQDHPDRTAWRDRTIPRRVQLVDVAPTIVEVAGLDVPSTFQGISLLDDLARPVFASRGKVAVMIDGDQKFWVRPQKPARWFDLAEDPGEKIDLVPGREEEAKAFRKRVRAMIEQQRARRAEIVGEAAGEKVEMDEAMRKRLEAMGYLKEGEE